MQRRCSGPIPCEWCQRRPAAFVLLWMPTRGHQTLAHSLHHHDDGVMMQSIRHSSRSTHSRPNCGPGKPGMGSYRCHGLPGANAYGKPPPAYNLKGAPTVAERPITALMWRKVKSAQPIIDHLLDDTRWMKQTCVTDMMHTTRSEGP
jgi:hypothetical protein